MARIDTRRDFAPVSGLHFFRLYLFYKHNTHVRACLNSKEKSDLDTFTFHAFYISLHKLILYILLAFLLLLKCNVPFSPIKPFFFSAAVRWQGHERKMIYFPSFAIAFFFLSNPIIRRRKLPVCITEAATQQIDRLYGIFYYNGTVFIFHLFYGVYFYGAHVHKQIHFFFIAMATALFVLKAVIAASISYILWIFVMLKSCN